SGTADLQASEMWQYRLVPALFGLLLIPLTLLFGRWLGPGPALWAAAFTAISHAMVFYSGYYVQEMLFVFFALLLIYCWLRYLERPALTWAIGTGLAAGLLHATKETCVLVFAALGLATAFVYA